jgi:hypothetical protein
MKCPYEEELKTGKMVCDAGYDKSQNAKQCPTAIFNWCQSYTYSRDIIANILKNDLNANVSEAFVYEIADKILDSIR